MRVPKDGGAAFPLKCHLGDHNHGMSLRDYFAGQALHGFCALAGFNHDNTAWAAHKCYELADAMIAAREKEA